MSLTLDYTLFVQIALFLVLWACLKRLMFAPMSQVLAAREARTSGTQASARALMAEAEQARVQHAEAIHRARIEIAQRLDGARKTAQEEYDRAVADARGEVDAELTRQRTALALQVDGVRQTLAAEADAVAGEMLRRVTDGAATVLTIAALLLPAAVHAATDAHGEHGHGVPWPAIGFSTVNTLIFVYILVRFAWPTVRDWVAERRRVIVETLEAAARAKADAESLKQEWEQRLASLAREIDEMRAQARAEAERERDRILAAARRAAETIRRDAARAAEQDVRNARDQLRAEVARRAYTLACERAQARLTAADQDRFIDDFVQQVTT